MKQIQDEELSALLDGELDAQRAEEVRARIKADPALRKEFDALARLDQRLSYAAEQAAFLPELSFPEKAGTERPAWHWKAAIVVVLALLVARLLPKLAELPLIGIGLHVAAIVAISAIVMTMARETNPKARST